MEKDTAEQTVVWKSFKTISVVAVYICLGLNGEITGPTLLDLKSRTHANYESISTGVSGLAFGSLIGAVLGGVLVDKVGRFSDIMVALALDVQAIATAAIPWMPNTALIFVMTFVQGLIEGTINTVAQKIILTMWKEKAAGPVHLIHAGFGIGSFIIPLIANPFLTITRKQEMNVSTVNFTHSRFVDVTTIGSSSTDLPEVVVKQSKMEYAYLIAAIITVCVSLVFYGYHFTGGKEREKLKESTALENSDTRPLTFKEMFNPATCAGGRFFYGVQILFLVFLYFIFTMGGEKVAGKFIRTYAIKHLDFSEDDGSYINTVFWLAFTVGRVLGLVTARFIPIRILIMLETAGCLVTSIILMIYGEERSYAVWVLIACIGFFIGPLFPSGVGWTNHHIKMTGLSITFFLLGASVGALIYMKLTGYMFDHYGYRSFLYLLLSFGIAVFIFATVMNLVGSQHGSRFEGKKNEVEMKTDDKSEAIEKDNSEKL